MSDGRADLSLLIGLHKIADQTGDGLVPELYALLTRRREAAGEIANVVAFPECASSGTSAIRRQKQPGT